jgi:VWFA-related protein
MLDVRGRTTFGGLCTVLSVLCATFGITVSGQDTNQPRKTFYAPLEVPLVNVDVYVTDKSGKPVSGLDVSDFRVSEDGEPVDISHFYAASGVTIKHAEPSDAEAEIEAEVEAEEEPAQDLFLVIFVDDTNLSRGRRQSAIKHLRGFLAADVPPGLNVMMISYDGRLQVVLPFTQDISQVSTALDSMAKMGSLSRRSEEERLIMNMEATRAVVVGASSQQAEDIIENGAIAQYQDILSYADQLADRTRTGCANLTKLIRSLSGLHGRKALLLVNDGVEPRPGERLFRVWGEIYGSEPMFRTEAQMAFFRANQNNLNSEFNELARQANSHRVTLYTLSALEDGQMRGISADRRIEDTQRLSVIQTMSEEVLASNLADQTGGRPLVNSPALGDQLSEVSQELTSYYSLAYRPHHAGDGNYHRIKVEILRDGARVNHRNGYYDLPPEDQMNNRVLAAAIHGVGENKMGIAVRTFEPTQREDGAYLVPVIVMVPVGELILTPSADEHQGRISVILAVRDERGGLSDLQRREYPITVPNELLAESIGKTAGFTTRLAVRGGKQRIAVGVLDEVSRSESVATIDLEVPGTDG